MPKKARLAVLHWGKSTSLWQEWILPPVHLPDISFHCTIKKSHYFIHQNNFMSTVDIKIIQHEQYSWPYWNGVVFLLSITFPIFSIRLDLPLVFCSSGFSLSSTTPARQTAAPRAINLIWRLWLLHDVDRKSSVG